jgi:hypothetical protein
MGQNLNLTWKEVWNRLKQVPPPDSNIILSVGVTEYYTKVVYDLMKANNDASRTCPYHTRRGEQCVWGLRGTCNDSPCVRRK